MLNKVNNFLCQRQMIRQFFRYIHCEPSSKILYPLQNRKLLHISGNEASVFLQGLITNDMKHFEDNAKSIYAMFLNNKGRVLYDTLIHKWEGEGSFMIECDKNIHIILQKHLKLYKLKRRVDIKDVQDDYKLWALIAPMQSISESIGDAKPNINIYKDPRLTDLGFRILSKANLEGSEIAGYIAKDITVETSDEGYRYLRYKLGVSEGCDDLPPGSSFPLEANCDYLHGVSFHKGCYIGQELTARVHHTGVVRKRIMPIKFTEPITENLEKDTVISSVENKKLNIGKLKSYVKDYGLGLVRIKEALDSGLQIGSKHAAAMRPSWWPVEAPKEKASSLKSE